MCNKLVSQDLFKLKHCHDRHIDDLLVLNFAPDCFVTSKIIYCFIRRQ